MNLTISNWYVVQTKAGDEEKVKEKIEKLKINNLQTFLPRRKLLIRRKGIFLYELKPLYPGYFFINMKLEPAILSKLYKVSGLIRILGDAKRKPKPVPENEMKIIFSMINENDIVVPSQALFVNDRIKIVGGPLKGLEGYITAVDKRKKRVKVKLPFFNSYKEVYLSIELLEKL